MRVNSIIETIGDTPHIKINRLFGDNHNVWMKQERTNPGGSIKDRIGLAMINDAERRGIINNDTTIIEPTSGNTGIGLAMVAAARGYKIILVMPESMSLERRQLMKAYGAQLELTPREKGMRGSIERAQELIASTPNSWMPMQFENQANVEIHRRTTAAEILADFPEGIDYLITGVGTGGHITGCAHALREKFPKLQVYGVEAEKSSVIAGGSHSPHKIQGISAGFIPAILDREALTGTISVSEEDAFLYAQRSAKEEGILIGISSGASLAAVTKILPDIKPGSTILTFCYDTGERYLSVPGLFPTA